MSVRTAPVYGKRALQKKRSRQESGTYGLFYQAFTTAVLPTSMAFGREVFTATAVA